MQSHLGLVKDVPSLSSDEKTIYLTGHSLGLQPRVTNQYIQAHLTAWATKGVRGHFTTIQDSPLPAFVDIDDVAAKSMAKLIGASPSEVAVMQTLTANLHLLMASFYRPDPKKRFKILLEGKAFPSDHVCLMPLRPILLHNLQFYPDLDYSISLCSGMIVHKSHLTC